VSIHIFKTKKHKGTVMVNLRTEGGNELPVNKFGRKGEVDGCGNKQIL
jgi:hypothetical protein